jgi:hypothetical protein
MASGWAMALGCSDDQRLEPTYRIAATRVGRRCAEEEVSKYSTHFKPYMKTFTNLDKGINRAYRSPTVVQ